jgi:Tfp pilus assembly protein FimT
MLSRRRGVRGLTLVELLTSLALFVIILTAATPSLSAWLQGERARSAAHEVLRGLSAARAEAVSRNDRVRFQLTSTLGADCMLDTHGRNWVLTLDDGSDPAVVQRQCDAPLSDTDGPRILSRLALGGAPVQVEASVPTIAFNGFGRPVSSPTDPVVVNVSPVAGGCDAEASAACFRVTVSPEGALRVCNARLGPEHADDPRRC